MIENFLSEMFGMSCRSIPMETFTGCPGGGSNFTYPGGTQICFVSPLVHIALKPVSGMRSRRILVNTIACMKFADSSTEGVDVVCDPAASQSN